MAINPLLTVTTVAYALFPPAAVAAQEWSTESVEADGMLVESRSVPESAFPELRVTVTTQAPVSALASAAWELRDDGMQTLYLDQRPVPRASPNERLLYLRLSLPVVGKRECVLHQSRSFDPVSHAAHVTFRAMPLGRAQSEVVRFSQLRGDWSFEPEARGGTRIIYHVLTDVGRLPAWLGRGPQHNAAAATVREVILRASAHAGR